MCPFSDLTKINVTIPGKHPTFGKDLKDKYEKIDNK